MAFPLANNHTLREWAPLTDLFSKLPPKAQIGFFSQDIKITCLDVLPDYLALGTNFGMIYWYNRKQKDLQRLRCENVNIPITTVKIISTVDYMVACGDKNGKINIFQIPKSHPDSIPESLKPKNKQVERYTVSELHSSAISALEWSKNGMKLFSGDTQGHIVLTEIDFYMHICKSVEILNESYEIVQLSYYQQNLLVSTTYRSIICRKEDKWKVAQIGKKDRKILANFGGIFYKNSLRPSDVGLYCTRPGLRIWVSDLEGSVQQTLLFKDILRFECPEIPVINPISNNLKLLKPQKEASFGILLSFNDELLVTFNNDVLYVLNPKDLSVISVVSQLRSVLAVSTCKDEIFILEGERSVIRLSYKPESYEEPTLSIPTASPFSPFTTSIKDFTNKLQLSFPPLHSAGNSELNIHVDTTSIINAEEAIESPVKSAGELADRIKEAKEKLKIYSKIGEEDFDDTILFKHRRSKKQSDTSCSIASWSSSSSDEKDASVSVPTLMNISTVGVLPDLRSPETIKSDIECKEKMLADVLSFDKIKVSIDDFKNCNSKCKDEKLKTDHRENHNKNKEIKVVNKCDKETILPLRSTFLLAKESKINQVTDYGIPSGSNNPNSTVDTPPACMNIPMDWKLKQVTVNSETDTSASDLSLGDWELL